MADERAPQRLGAPEAAAAGHDAHGSIGRRLECPAGRFDAHALHVAARGLPHPTHELPLEVARAQGDQRGEAVHGQVGIRVRVDVVLGEADRPRLGGGRPDRGGELALTAGPTQEHHEMAGDELRQLGAMVLLDHGQREVDAGGDPRRGPAAAVADPEGVTRHDQFGKLVGETVGVGPVGGDRPGTEHPGRGQQEGAGAHRRHPAGVGGMAGDTVERGRVDSGGVHPAAPGDDQGVHREAVVEAPVGHEGQAAGAPDGAGDRGGEHDVVRLGAECVVGPGEDVVGARDVQALDAGVDDDDDRTAPHGFTVRPRSSVSNDGPPTDPASTRDRSSGTSGGAGALR